MHTGVLYVSQMQPRSFCTLSDSRTHDPIAIWAYLEPVLNDLKTEFPNIQTIHFFSDGPTMQYRQKKNFYLFSTKLVNFKFATWNFFEASHDKGATDVVGAVLKHTADRPLRQGIDMPSVQDVLDKLHNETSVKLYFVAENSVIAAADQFSQLAELQSVLGQCHCIKCVLIQPNLVKYYIGMLVAFVLKICLNRVNALTI